METQVASCGFVRIYIAAELFSCRDISNNDIARNPCNLVNNTKENFQSERIHFFNLHLITGSLRSYSSR